MKKLKESIKNLNLQTKIFLSILLIIYIKTQGFYFMTWSFKNFMLPIITIGILALFLLPMLFFKKTKTAISYGICINVIVSLLLLSNAIYYEYANNFLSVFQITNAKYGSEILSALPSLIKIYHLVFVFDLIGYVIYKLSNKNKEKKYIEKNFNINIKERKIAVICIVATSILSLTYAYFKPEDSLKKRFWSKNTLIAESTIFGYHYYDLVNFFQGNKNVPFKTFSDVAENYKSDLNAEKHEVNKYLDIKDIAKGKNVILLQLEAIQNFIIGEKINGKEITPNLNKFFAENIQFTNMHSQGLGTTADSEHTVLNSLYPLENGSVYQFYAGNKYYNLLNVTKDAGYYTSFMHANDKGFWNRFNVYNNVGVDVFEDIKSFEPITEWISCWPSDELFFTQAVDKMINYPKPFITNMVAVSSHYPFSLEGIQNKEEKIKIDVSPYNGTIFGNYLETANYVDYAFGKFIDDLKEKGLYDDSVIVVYGDHYAMNVDDKEMLSYLESIGKPLNKIKQKINYTNVAFGMSIPGVSHMVIEDPVGKTDIKPTLLKMLGIKDKFSIGEDLFANDGYVSISNYSVITKDKMYTDGKWFDINQGTELKNIPEEEKVFLDSLVENMTKEVQMSESIIKKDLLKDTEQVDRLYEELNK